MALLPSILDAVGLEPGLTRFWLIRHALVEENARARLYGIRDVPLCPESLVAQVPMYQALAARLPDEADWIVTPLSRTRRTADAIAAWRPHKPELAVEPGLIEQDLGDWQGLAHAELPPLLSQPAHPFRASPRARGRGGKPWRRDPGGGCARAGPNGRAIASAIGSEPLGDDPGATRGRMAGGVD